MTNYPRPEELILKTLRLFSPAACISLGQAVCALGCNRAGFGWAPKDQVTGMQLPDFDVWSQVFFKFLGIRGQGYKELALLMTD